MILTPDQAYAHVFGSDVEAIGAAVAFELGLACSRSEGAGALSDWALARSDNDPALAAFSGLLDCWAWGAVTIMRGEEAA
jgi:hypothetical protein